MSIPDVKRVAVIGAGISGVCTAAHLLRVGIEVTVFERGRVAGGVWVYDEEVSLEPTYPSETPSKGDFDRVPEDAFDAGYLTPPRTPDEKDAKTAKPPSWTKSYSRLEHAPPSAAYAGLRNNVPLSLMQNTLRAFPAELTDYEGQIHLEQYIQGIAESERINEHTQFNTRVEDVQKIGNSWQVRTSTRVKANNDRSRLILRTWHFDAVVVAIGHYHMPRIPDIPGLKEWKARYPDRVSHSKTYRRPSAFKDQTVLLIGAGTSSTDIAKELAGHSKHTYQSSRGGSWDHPASALPANATRIGALTGFELDESVDINAASSIPGKVLRKNGQRLCNIDRVVLCTGYITSYPFLPQYHDNTLSMHEAGESVIVTREGNMVHNLHKDIFYMQDPSLVFVGKPYNTANFSLFEKQAQLVARVFSKVVPFPSIQEMRDEYNERVRARGLGKDFHSLRPTGAEVAYVDELVAWGNKDLADGVEPMQGHSDAWRQRYNTFKVWVEARLAQRDIENAARAKVTDEVPTYAHSC